MEARVKSPLGDTLASLELMLTVQLFQDPLINNRLVVTTQRSSFDQRHFPTWKTRPNPGLGYIADVAARVSK